MNINSSSGYSISWQDAKDLHTKLYNVETSNIHKSQVRNVIFFEDEETEVFYKIFNHFFDVDTNQISDVRNDQKCEVSAEEFCYYASIRGKINKPSVGNFTNKLNKETMDSITEIGAFLSGFYNEKMLLQFDEAFLSEESSSRSESMSEDNDSMEDSELSETSISDSNSDSDGFSFNVEPEIGKEDFYDVKMDRNLIANEFGLTQEQLDAMLKL